MSKMKADTWKTILQIAISVLRHLPPRWALQVVWDRIDNPFLNELFVFFIRTFKLGGVRHKSVTHPLFSLH